MPLDFGRCTGLLCYCVFVSFVSYDDCWPVLMRNTKIHRSTTHKCLVLDCKADELTHYELKLLTDRHKLIVLLGTWYKQLHNVGGAFWSVLFSMGKLEIHPHPRDAPEVLWTTNPPTHTHTNKPDVLFGDANSATIGFDTHCGEQYLKHLQFLQFVPIF